MEKYRKTWRPTLITMTTTTTLIGITLFKICYPIREQWGTDCFIIKSSTLQFLQNPFFSILILGYSPLVTLIEQPNNDLIDGG